MKRRSISLKVFHSIILLLGCSNGCFLCSLLVRVIASVVPFELLPHPHLAESVIAAVLLTWRNARTILALKKRT
jgi:hypothetical protein